MGNNFFEIEEKKYKLHPKLEEAQKYITDLFKNAEGQLDNDAIANVVNELKKMLEFFENDNVHYIRGMSVFIAIDTE